MLPAPLAEEEPAAALPNGGTPHPMLLRLPSSDADPPPSPADFRVPIEELSDWQPPPDNLLGLLQFTKLPLRKLPAPVVVVLLPPPLVLLLTTRAVESDLWVVSCCCGGLLSFRNPPSLV